MGQKCHRPLNPDLRHRRWWITVPQRIFDAEGLARVQAESAAEPDNFAKLERWVIFMVRMKTPEHALAALGNYINRHPKDVAALLFRSDALRTLDRVPESVVDARRACELGSNEGCGIAAKSL